jgi:hypothetical protein
VYLSVWDVILTPVFLIVLGLIAKTIRDKHYPKGNPLRKYYLPGLFIKFGGAIFIAIIYQFYYAGGDTYNYFYHSKIINSALDESISTWFQLITRQPLESEPRLYNYIARLEWYHDPSSYSVAVIGAIMGLTNGTTYIPIALLFAFFSYTGIWAMYKTFVNIYPKRHKELALAFLFIPSTFVWGSAIFKDTICMFSLGWLTYTTFRIFVNKDFSFKNLSLLVLSFYLIALIKLYILLAFLPALSLWLLMTYSHKIRSTGVRFVVNVLFIGVIIGGFFLFTQKFAEEMNKYSLEQLAKTSSTTRQWIHYASGDEGASYNLGEIDGTLTGMLSKFPQAVVVTLFRPFPWEARKVIVALSALEALIFSYFTLKILFTRRSNLKLMIKDPNITFCLVYAIIFAFAVGVSSYNFGALSRYKIPCLPFYGTFLMLAMQKKSDFVLIRKKDQSRNKQLQPTI